MVDGCFPPLDTMFTESDMLTIMRGVPVGRYLQPTGRWEDGLDIPFVYVRHQIFIRLRFGPFTLADVKDVTNIDKYEIVLKVRIRFFLLTFKTISFHRFFLDFQDDFIFITHHPYSDSFTAGP